MSRLSDAYPFLNHLGDRTRLVDSPFFQKMDAKWAKFIKEHQSVPDAVYTGYVVCCRPTDACPMEVVPLVMATLNQNWPRMMSRFRTNVALVSEPFMAAVKDAADVFRKDPVTTSSYLAGKTFSGTVLVSSKHHTVGYSLEFDEKGALIDYGILWLDKYGGVCAVISPELQFISRSILFGDKNEMKQAPLFLEHGPLHCLSESIVDTVKGFLLFCHFAEITDDIVARPGSRQAREQAGSGETCVNDTRFNVRRLSVTYFKNICREEDFPVRGHFRMQPYGVGRTHRRLIYVDSFVKHGYHRRAGKLAMGEYDNGIII